ncbi:MAG: AAA family ATPase [Candidatus Methanomethylophilaceae archaeon]
MIIALAGKGGVGKSTISSQLIRMLSRDGVVLAVDADPNSNLCDKLGMEVLGSVGELRNDIVDDPDIVPAGISKQEYVANHVRQIISEEGNVDLLVMGRPQGQGCYCFVNGVMKECLANLIPAYGNVVIDNEAGMEHLSRRTLPKADVIIFVSDPTKTGIKTASRLSGIVDEVSIEAGRRVLVINNVAGDAESLIRYAGESGFEEVFVLPHDEFISRSAMDSESLDVPADTDFGKALAGLMRSLTGK